jgi:predicted signal transduction protein with EAL and GGDEF domain
VFDASGLSASFGIGGFVPPEAPDFEKLVARADAAPYAGKGRGGLEIRLKDN